MSINGFVKTFAKTMPQDIKEHLILENRCKDITFYNTMQYKVLEMCIFGHIFLHFAKWK